MSNGASADNLDEHSIKKEAVDALAQLKEAERKDTFDYFQALLEFKKHASDTKRP